MKVSLNWLKDYVKFDMPDRDYAELMTSTGTKVETIEKLGEDIENVVAGKIDSVTPHPDSDHLVICMVDVGGEKPLQIVTGAQNVHAGDFVPVCLNGAKLPGGKLTALQKRALERINRAGGIARRVESVEDVKEIIRQADEERRKP